MSEIADRLTTVLARDIVTAANAGLRVFAVTTPLSLVAGLAARRLGAPGVAIATGFGVIDAVDPFPAVTLGEAALGVEGAVQSPASDTFVALARQRLGVMVAPVQVDARGATNLSRIGGTDERPKVALPGSRGLPENNDAPAWLWYLVADPRRLVERVDFVSGAPPAPGRFRRLLSPMGIFDLEPGGWRATALWAGVTPEEISAQCGFPVDVSAAGALDEPSREELDALAAVDPHGLRALDVPAGEDLREIVAAAAAAEADLRAAQQTG